MYNKVFFFFSFYEQNVNVTMVKMIDLKVYIYITKCVKLSMVILLVNFTVKAFLFSFLGQLLL